MSDRMLPHNLEAERSVLGAIIAHNETLGVVEHVLRPSDFFLESHRRIYGAITELADAGAPIDLLTLNERLSRGEGLDDVGGVAYLASLIDGVPRSTNVEYYARVVKDKAAWSGEGRERVDVIVGLGQMTPYRACVYHPTLPPRLVESQEAYAAALAAGWAYTPAALTWRLCPRARRAVGATRLTVLRYYPVNRESSASQMLTMGLGSRPLAPRKSVR